MAEVAAGRAAARSPGSCRISPARARRRPAVPDHSGGRYRLHAAVTDVLCAAARRRPARARARRPALGRRADARAAAPPRPRDRRRAAADPRDAREVDAEDAPRPRRRARRAVAPRRRRAPAPRRPARGRRSPSSCGASRRARTSGRPRARRRRWPTSRAATRSWWPSSASTSPTPGCSTRRADAARSTPSACRRASATSSASASRACRATAATCSSWPPSAVARSSSRVLRAAAPLDEAGAAARARRGDRAAACSRRCPGARIAYRFRHELLRRAVLDRLPAARRAALHLRLAEALEAVHGAEDDRSVTDLALHFGQAAASAARERAIRYALRAAELAARSFAYEDAARRCSAALDLGIADPATRAQGALRPRAAAAPRGPRARGARELRRRRRGARARSGDARAARRRRDRLRERVLAARDRRRAESLALLEEALGGAGRRATRRCASGCWRA